MNGIAIIADPFAPCGTAIAVKIRFYRVIQQQRLRMLMKPLLRALVIKNNDFLILRKISMIL
jgi:hypothetical protein